MQTKMNNKYVWKNKKIRDMARKRGKLVEKYTLQTHIYHTQKRWNNRKLENEAKILQQHADNMNIQPIYDYTKRIRTNRKIKKQPVYMENGTLTNNTQDEIKHGPQS